MNTSLRLEKFLLFSLLPGCLPLLVKFLTRLDNLPGFQLQVGDLLGIGVGSATFGLLELIDHKSMKLRPKLYFGTVIFLWMIMTAVLYTKDEALPKQTYVVASAVVTLFNVMTSLLLLWVLHRFHDTINE